MRHIAILTVLLGLLLPARLPAQYSRRRPASATANSGPYNGPAVTFNGTVKTLTKKELTVDLDPTDPGADRQSLTFRVSKKTKFLKDDQPIKPSDIEVGVHISLDQRRRLETLSAECRGRSAGQTWRQTRREGREVRSENKDAANDVCRLVGHFRNTLTYFLEPDLLALTEADLAC